jgi:hypothetical protein
MHLLVMWYRNSGVSKAVICSTSFMEEGGAALEKFVLEAKHSFYCLRGK